MITQQSDHLFCMNGKIVLRLNEVTLNSVSNFAVDFGRHFSRVKQSFELVETIENPVILISRKAHLIRIYISYNRD